MSTINWKILQLIFSNCFHGKRPLGELKLVKRGKTSIFIVNKRLREAKVKFLIEHDKIEFKYCIITFYFMTKLLPNLIGSLLLYSEFILH